MKPGKVTIIGAGPAGLSAAYFLIQRGVEPAVFEAGKETGGLGGSVLFFGKSFDIGPHIFLESSQREAVEFWKEIGGNDLVTMQLSRGMILNRKLIRFPPEPLGVLRAFGPHKLMLAGFGALRAKLLKNESFANSGEFFQNRYGAYFRQHVFNPFCEKYMGIPDVDVDRDFATGLTSFVKESGKEDVTTDEQQLKSLIYPKQGTKMIWSRIAERVMKQGSIHLEKKLSRMVCDDDKVTRLCFADGTETEPAFVVSSLPLVTLLQLMDTTPAHLLELSKKLRYRNTVLVYLQLPDVACDFHYATAFDHSLEAGRITHFNQWPLESLAGSAETVLCVEYWCGHDDLNWTCTDEAIVSKAVSELGKAGILKEGGAYEAGVLRLAKSHPVLSTEHVAALAEINAYLLKFKNLVLAGRHATFKWDGQADNISAGMKLAEQISALVTR